MALLKLWQINGVLMDNTHKRKVNNYLAGVYIDINLRFMSGVYKYITITKGIIMKTIKLTKKQLEILRHCLGEYRQFLASIDDEQLKEEQERYGRNLGDNLQRLEKKLYG